MIVYDCKVCRTEFTHEPLKYVISTKIAPKMEYYFCSLACLKGFTKGFEEAVHYFGIL